jgi:hypothetical protein
MQTILWKFMVRRNFVLISSLRRRLHCQSWLDAQHWREISHSSMLGLLLRAAHCASAQLRITIRQWALMKILAGALILIVFAAAIGGFLNGKKMR